VARQRQTQGSQVTDFCHTKFYVILAGLRHAQGDCAWICTYIPRLSARIRGHNSPFPCTRGGGMHEGFTGLCRAVPSPGVALAAYGRRMMRAAALCVVCLLGVNPACAGLLAAATRVIVGEGQRDVSLMLANTNDYPVIVQTWVDRGEANPDVLAPFVSLPSVFHLPPQAVQGLRILLVDAQTLPRDRESVFWLNLHEVPPTRNATAREPRDTLALAMNTALKIFYRPKDLPRVDVAAQLRFALERVAGTWVITCRNPTPYHASFTTLEVVTKT